MSHQLPPLPGIETGEYLVKGLGARKQAYIAAGADLNFLASAMMETERMDPTSYPLGDHLNGVGKIDDAFNAGACKQNWGMMRPVYGPWKRLGPKDYKTAATLNHNKQLDVFIYKLCLNQYGRVRFLAGHRNGTAGLASPNTPDISNFIRGWQWTKYLLLSDPENLLNDVRFWVQLKAI